MTVSALSNSPLLIFVHAGKVSTRSILTALYDSFVLGISVKHVVAVDQPDIPPEMTTSPPSLDQICLVHSSCSADHQFSMATEADCHAPVKEATVAGEEGENRGPGADVDGSGHKDGNVSGNDDDDDKSSDTATSPSRSPSTTECRGGNVLTPSSDLAKSGSVVITQDNEAVARGRSATNALHDVACADDSGVDHEGPLSRRTSRAPSSKRKPSSPMIHARTKGRSRSNVGLFSGKRRVA